MGHGTWDMGLFMLKFCHRQTRKGHSFLVTHVACLSVVQMTTLNWSIARNHVRNYKFQGYAILIHVKKLQIRKHMQWSARSWSFIFLDKVDSAVSSIIKKELVWLSLINYRKVLGVFWKKRLGLASKLCICIVKFCWGQIKRHLINLASSLGKPDVFPVNCDLTYF